MAKYDLAFASPLMNAAGVLGFAPPTHAAQELSWLGAFVTNPISLGRRTPAHGPRCLPCPGGFLLHTGYPNPGLNAVLRRCASRWARSTLPVIVHLLPQRVDELPGMLRRLEGLEGLAGLEIGLPPEVDAAATGAFTQAAAGELPVIVRLPLERAAELAGAAVATGAAAVSLAPPRGALPAAAGAGGQRLVEGRLYGPAVYPLALAAVRAIAGQGLPVIGAGGVYSAEQANAMLAAGALAVQLDSIIWRDGLQLWN
jgi:dihydroorotate dehydrogenase (NAD+) catalytic subunit